MKTRNRIIDWIAFLFLLFAILPFNYSCMGGKRHSGIKPTTHLKITSFVSKIENEVVVNHLGYMSSFNPLARIPNWIAYDLTKEEVAGTVKRDNGFYPDPDLPLSVQATFGDYRNNDGWDKGHMAPAGDMKWSRQAMHESCFFTNICPQNRNLNNGDWKSLEEKCRSWAQKYGIIYIVCGPIIGDMKNGTLGENKVVIPDAFFKVLMVRVGDEYEGIGFVFENKAGHQDLFNYAMSIDSVESMTGMDFFHQLPDKVENKVEADYHKEVWMAH